MPFFHILTAYMSSLHIDVTRGDVAHMTEFDVISSRNFSLAGIHIDKDDGTMSWRRGAQHQPDPDAQVDEFMLTLFPEEAAPAPPPPPARAPRHAPRSLADRMTGLERAMASLQQENSDFHRDMRREVAELRAAGVTRHTELMALLRSLGSGPPPSSSQ